MKKRKLNWNFIIYLFIVILTALIYIFFTGGPNIPCLSELIKPVGCQTKLHYTLGCFLNLNCIRYFLGDILGLIPTNLAENIEILIILVLEYYITKGPINFIIDKIRRR